MNVLGKIIIMGLNCGLTLLFFSSSCYATIFEDSVPKGREIKDPYIEQLFVPEFQYESIKVIEMEEGKRYVVIRAKQTITDEIRRNYEKKVLPGRKIRIYRSGSIRTDTLLISEMRFERMVSEIPYVVEYCKVKGERLEPGLVARVEDVVRSEGKYLIILINKDFGKVFKRVEIYPEKESGCPEPPFVGKYPNSRSTVCTEKNKWFTFIVVSKDKSESIYDYYRDKLKNHYKKVGFNFPERFWKFDDKFGIQIRYMEVDQWDEFSGYMKSERKINSPPPANGVIFHVVINRGSPASLIEDYSFITIYYSIDPAVIHKNIERMKRYPKEEK